MATKKTTRRPAKKRPDSMSKPAENDIVRDTVRELLECGAALEKRVAELEMKVASIERVETERRRIPHENYNFSPQVYGQPINPK